LDDDVAARAVAPRGEAAADGGVRNTRERGELRLQLLDERAAFVVVGVFRTGQRHVAGEHAVGFPAGIALREALDTAGEKRRAGEQGERERDLGDDERVTQAVLRGTGA